MIVAMNVQKAMVQRRDESLRPWYIHIYIFIHMYECTYICIFIYIYINSYIHLQPQTTNACMLLVREKPAPLLDDICRDPVAPTEYNMSRWLQSGNRGGRHIPCLGVVVLYGSVARTATPNS